MLLRCKRDKRIVYAVCLPHRLLLAKVAGVAREAKRDFVMPPVLSRLVAEVSWMAVGGRFCSRRTQQSHANRLIGGFVRAVLHIGQQSHPKVSTPVGQINPTMRGHLVLPRLRIGPLDGADVPAIGCFGLRRAERKSSLEVGACRLPVDRIVKIDAVAGIARSKADGLYKSGAFGYPGNFERDARRTTLTDANFWRPTDKSARSGLFLCVVHVPRWIVARNVSRNRQLERRGEQFPAELLVIDTRHISIPIEMHLIPLVF